MFVEGLWRYPVKSLGGEALPQAELTAAGIRGDRLVHVHGTRGHLTGRSRHGLLTLPATTGPDGRALVAGEPWDSPAAAALVREHGGPDARLRAYDGPERFDILSLSVATDSAVAELGSDVRRLRPNLLIGGVAPGAEREWQGRALAIGNALVGIYALRMRCIVTTIDPDTGEQDIDVLLRIRDHFDQRISLDCWVVEPGTIRIGDPVELTDTQLEPEQIGGWTLGAPYLASRPFS